MNIISLWYSLQAMTKYPSLLYTSKLQIHLLHTTKNYFGHLTKIYCEKQVMYLSIFQRKNVFAISFLLLQQERFATSSMVIKVFELSVIVFETTLSYFCRISILPYWDIFVNRTLEWFHTTLKNKWRERLTYNGTSFAIGLNQRRFKISCSCKNEI